MRKIILLICGVLFGLGGTAARAEVYVLPSDPDAEAYQQASEEYQQHEVSEAEMQTRDRESRKNCTGAYKGSKCLAARKLMESAENRRNEIKKLQKQIQDMTQERDKVKRRGRADLVKQYNGHIALTNMKIRENSDLLQKEENDANIMLEQLMAENVGKSMEPIPPQEQKQSGQPRKKSKKAKAAKQAKTEGEESQADGY